MNTQTLPGGVYPALWTPGDGTSGIDAGLLRDHLRRLRGSQPAGWLALGTTGEFLLLDPADRKRVLSVVGPESNGIAAVANVSDVRLPVVIELGRHARTLGFAAVALMTPYFFSYTQADILEFLSRASDAIQMPVALYSFVERTGNPLELETITAFAERAPLVAFKQSGGRWEFQRDLVALGRQKGFTVLTGADRQLLAAMELGVAGCVSGLANFIPELMGELYRAAMSGKRAEAEPATMRVEEVGRLCDGLTYPLCIAAGMEARGWDPGPLRQVVSPESRRLYNGLRDSLAQCFAAWGISGP